MMQDDELARFEHEYHCFAKEDDAERKSRQEKKRQGLDSVGKALKLSLRVYQPLGLLFAIEKALEQQLCGNSR